MSVTPFLGVAERRFWFVYSIALVPGASTARVPMIWRKHQVTRFRQRLHQKHALCIAASKPVRKQNQRMSGRWSSPQGPPQGDVSSRNSDMVCFLRTARPKRKHKISQDAGCQFRFHWTAGFKRSPQSRTGTPRANTPRRQFLAPSDSSIRSRNIRQAHVRHFRVRVQSGLPPSSAAHP
jgi:hypothetical protein